MALLHFSAVLASADTFFFLAPSGEQNVNDMGLWKRLSTYDSSGDNWEFYVFPEGTDDRITLDKGNHAAGAIGADQSQGITSDSDVIIKQVQTRRIAIRRICGVRRFVERVEDTRFYGQLFRSAK